MDKDHRQWEEIGLRAAVLRGDQEAWRVLYDRCFESLYAYIDYRTGHQREITEEIAQESWMVAVQRIKSFDPTRSGFGAWLRGIALNHLRNHWRKAARVKPVDKDVAEKADRPVPQRDLAERIGRAMTALSERYQAVLRAKYEELMPLADIADRWQESTKAIESLLSRARQAFREAYAQMEKEP